MVLQKIYVRFLNVIGISLQLSKYTRLSHSIAQMVKNLHLGETDPVQSHAD